MPARVRNSTAGHPSPPAPTTKTFADKINFEEVDSLPDSIRGKGGFGSTGK